MTAMSVKIDGLSTNLNNLTNTTVELQGHVRKIEKDITDRIDKLDRTISDEIVVLKNADQNLQNQLTDLERNTSASIAEIKDEAEKDRALQTKSEKVLSDAHVIIAAQAKRINNLERECFRGMQHSRGFNIEIDGIPAVIGDHPLDLEVAVLELLRSINVVIEDYDIDTVHRLPSKQTPKTTIVRFISRKTVRLCHKNSHKLKDLADLDIKINGLGDDSQIFIRPSQCSYLKNLAFNCRVLKRSKLIAKVLTAKDGRLTIEQLDGSFLKISHMEDLTKNFPSFQKFNFDYVDRDRERDGEGDPE